MVVAVVTEEKPITQKLWVAENAREREMIAELNYQAQELEELRFQLSRANARIKHLEGATRTPVPYVQRELTTPPRERGTVLQPGASGYTSYVHTTALGKRAYDKGTLPVLDLFILGLGTFENCSLDSLCKHIAIGDRIAIIRRGKHLASQNLVEWTFVKN